MNQLFTFNSQQFQSLTITHQQPHHPTRIRHKNKHQQPTDTPSLLSPLVLQSLNRPPHHLKSITSRKFPFHSPPSLQMENIYLPITNDCKSLDQQNISFPTFVSQHSNRYPLEVYDKHDDSTEEERRSITVFQKKSRKCQRANISRKLTTQRRQNRAQSVKVSPRMVIPLSDRKLPKVFKMNMQEHVLPRISVDRQQLAKHRKYRQIHSAKRSRQGQTQLGSCGRQLQRMQLELE